MTQCRNEITTKHTVSVLAFVNVYLPGFKGGGPARSLSNMVERLAERVEFRIVTSDRDKGDRKPYQNVINNVWNKVGSGEVFYICGGYRLVWQTWRILKNESYDIIYLNSFFHSTFSIIPLVLFRWVLRSSATLILAPRGEFSSGALAIKSIKKRSYLFFAKKIGLAEKIIWHASNTHEAEDIKRELGVHSTVMIASNIPSISAVSVKRKRRSPNGGNLIFLSRITPKKNLLGVVEMLKIVKHDVNLDIYGPVDDLVYWKKCRIEIEKLPENIHVRYKGTVSPSEVAAVFSIYDLFVFPTFGENYGHVIIESLAAGCPVLLSDQTPWIDLEEKKVGWCIPTSETSRFAKTIDLIAGLSIQEKDLYAERARAYAKKYAISEHIIESNIALFHDSHN